MEQTNSVTRRVGLLDEIRGADIILMVLYHLGYNLVYIFGVDVPYYRSFAMPYIQPLIAGTFILLSGIACRYSKSNVKRGIKTFLLGMLLTAVTLVFMPSESIYFGILHFMGAAMILFALARPALDLTPPVLGIPLFLFLYFFTGRVPRGYLGLPGVFTVTLPSSLYGNRYLLPLGFYGAGADYFPLIPHIFLYFTGAYVGVLFIRGIFPDWAYKTRFPTLSKIGRHTIVIYLLHQPILLGILFVIFSVIEKA